VWSFFLKAVVGNNTFDTAGADGHSALAKLLRDHFGRSVRIEKAVPDHLANDLGSPSVVGLGAAFLAQQPHRPLRLKRGSELEVPLLAIAVLLRGLDRSQAFAVPFDEHRQLVCDFILFGYVQPSSWPNQGVTLRIELRHDDLLGKRIAIEPIAVKDRKENSTRKGRKSLVKYGTTFRVIATHASTFSGLPYSPGWYIAILQ
jgi:hypothetical protein